MIIKLFRWINRLILLAVMIVVGFVAMAFYQSTLSIRQLFAENQRLSEAIRNLTREEQIGYAILESKTRDEFGKVTSVIRFVQTAPEDPNVTVSEQFFTVNGESIHFDALIVKFSNEFVKDGKARALYLWRRIYGGATPPVEGQPIGVPGSPPERYDESITRSLWFWNRQPFWDAIWDLANDPQQLSDYGITAVFGNAVYIRPQLGKAYLFKISRTGQIYPEVVKTY